MDSNNYVARARSFLRGRGARLALRIAPLAVMAVGVAHASTITFTPVNGTVTPFCTGCSGGGVVGSGSASSSALSNGISYFGSGGVTGGTGIEGLDFSYNGTASGTGPTTLNVSWDFTGTFGLLTTGLDVLTYDYTLKFAFNNGALTACATCSGTGSSGVPVIGTGSFSSPTGTITTYQAFFDFRFDSPSTSERMIISIPADLSVDVTNAAAGVPEPGTFLLLVPGLALFGVRALRRKQR